MKNQYEGIIETIARGVYVDNGHLLICRQRAVPLPFLPGGHVEFGESARAALEREWEEELGEAVRAEEFLGAIEHRFDQRGEPHAEINLVFRISGSQARYPDAPPVEEAHLMFEWVALDTLASMGLEPAPLRRLLPVWLDKNGVERFASTVDPYDR